MKTVARPIALWSSAETRARVYGFAALFSQVGLWLALLIAYQALHRPREVVRIGCDGIPELVRVDNRVYSEPAEREIRAFATEFSVKFMRADSFSAVNDAVDCARKMAPDLREQFKAAARGTKERPGTIAIIEGLKRRTQIDPTTLELTIDKSRYPWLVRAKGVRQIVGDTGVPPQPFELDVELVRADRNEVIEGLLVWSVHPRGESQVAMR